MLKEEFGDRIAKALTPAVVNKLDKGISDYIDRNNEILMTLDMSQRYSFADADRALLYNAVGISETEMKHAIAQSKAIYKGNKIQSNPFYLLSFLIVRYFAIKKDDEHARQVILYMSLMMYTSAHKGVFKYNANKQIMDYTIAHLSRNFYLRQVTSLYAFLEDNAATVYNTYKARLVNGTDTDLAYITDALWHRVKSKLQAIGEQYYKNHRSGNYLNADTDNYSEDDYREIDNNSFIIDRVVNKTYTKLINHQYDNRLLKYAITQSDVSYQKLKNLIEDIIDSDDGVRKVVSSIVEYYALASGKSLDYIGRGDFIVYMKTAYGTNTDTQQMAEIKNQIDKWLSDNMYKYGRANFGKTVRQSYRKSIYMFFVFIINMEAKA